MESSLKHPVILLFEDQQYLDESTKVLLDMGHEVYATQSPFEAINVIHNLTRSVILLIDYTMTQMQPRQFVKYIHGINRFDFFGILITEDTESDEKRIMREDSQTDGLLTYFQKSRQMPDGTTVYDLGTLYRRGIMTAEKMLNRFTHLTQDSLTKLPNRFGGLEQWQAVWTKRVIRDKGPLSFVALDFNGMRVINDLYGHPAGDILVKKFAERLLEESRADDVIIRLGGDEFLIIMTKTSRQKASAAIKRLKQVFEKAKFEIADGIYVSVHFCAGVATYTGNYAEDTAESVFKEYGDLADQSLFIEKKKNPNRNKTILAALEKKQRQRKDS